MNNPPELKARLAFLEGQINSLQATLGRSTTTESNNENISHPSQHQFLSNCQDQDSLKSILMSTCNKRTFTLLYFCVELKIEHQMVLKNIEKALEIVQINKATNSPAFKNNFTGQSEAASSSPSPRLREKISAVLSAGSVNDSRTNTNTNSHYSTSSPSTRRSFTLAPSTITLSSPMSSHINRQNFHPQQHQSSPLSPSMEKSQITFDILNDLERNDGNRKRVHFMNDADTDLSLASQDYLKKYGLI